MNRRRFIKTLGVACVGAASSELLPAGLGTFQGKVMTVLGPISPENMGVTLPHEHVLVDFIGADKVSRGRYNPDEAFKVIVPFFQQARKHGCRTLIECTPAYIGRDPELLKRLAASTGLHILSNTGYYGAADDKFVPAHAYRETADQLAARWLREWEDGIEGTGVRPGFIKIGVDAGPLSPIDRKLVQAAVRTHLKSGLTIASHTGDTEAGLDQLKTLREEGADASAFIWVHAQNKWDPDSRAKAAAIGAWIEIDNIAPGNVATCVRQVIEMKERGVLNRLLVSHDAGWYSVGEPGGGAFRSFDTLFVEFVPALEERGFNEADIRQILVDNPGEAFTIRVRRKR